MSCRGRWQPGAGDCRPGDQTSVRGAVEPKGLTSAARGIRPARARPPGRAQQAEPDPAGKRDDYPTRSRPRHRRRRCLIHKRIIRQHTQRVPTATERNDGADGSVRASKFVRQLWIFGRSCLKASCRCAAVAWLSGRRCGATGGGWSSVLTMPSDLGSCRAEAGSSVLGVG